VRQMVALLGGSLKDGSRLIVACVLGSLFALLAWRLGV